MIKHVLETKRRRRKLDLAKMMHVFTDGGSDDTVSHSEPDDHDEPTDPDRSTSIVRLLN